MGRPMITDVQAVGSLLETLLTHGGSTSTMDTFLGTSTTSTAPLSSSIFSISSWPYLEHTVGLLDSQVSLLT